VLIDGNNAQTGAVRAEAQRRGVTVHIVCDCIHVPEYLGKAARSFFEVGDPDAEEWVADRVLQILPGKPRAVAAGARHAPGSAAAPPNATAPTPRTRTPAHLPG
jgi:hypothetical protein